MQAPARLIVGICNEVDLGVLEGVPCGVKCDLIQNLGMVDLAAALLLDCVHHRSPCLNDRY